MWSPAAHLRDVDRVSMQFSDRECRVLWDALRSASVGFDSGPRWKDRVHNPAETAEALLKEFEPVEGKWLGLTNRELWTCIHALLEPDNNPDSDVLDRMLPASREIERLDSAANSVSYRGESWDASRRAAKRRAGMECEVCGSAPEKLDTHHRIPFRRFNTAAEANVSQNLLVVCPPCHSSIESAHYL